MHFSMTSRRSIPASRASSVGVRWIAIVQVPPVRFATWPGTVARLSDVINNKSSIRPKHSAGSRGKTDLPGSASDRIRDVDPHVLDAEPARQPVTERADPERLGRVVARGDEVDAGLAGERHDVLARLAGEE